MTTKAQKYVHKNAVVQAVEVTEDNLEKLAEKHGGTVHTSVRVPGMKYATVETDGGTQRLDVGCYVLVRHDDSVEVLNAEDFADYVKA